MPTITAQFSKQHHLLRTGFLTLSHSFTTEQITIYMKVNAGYVSTKTFPQTSEILQKLIPSIFTSQCFNDLQIPFYDELRETEMGHLLEHILLEFLCIEKLSNGYDEADFSGETSWNWILQPHGTFRISINCQTPDFVFFTAALQKSINVLEEIITSKLQKENLYFQPTYLSSPTI